MNPEDEKLFREYEHRLDEHHKTLDLWSMPRSKAVYAVLTVPDSVLMTSLLRNVPPWTDAVRGQHLKGMEEGVTQALRWLCGDGQTNVDSSADNNLIAAAVRYVLYASDYVSIADLHMMYGRGLADAAMDAAKKEVTFTPIVGPGQTDTSAWYEQVYDQTTRGMDLALRMKSEDIARSTRVLENIGYDLVQGRIVLAELPEDLVPSFGETLLQSRGLEHVPLPSDTDLIGFTVDDFWRFMAPVTAWSRAAFFRHHRCVLRRVPAAECMPTQIVRKASFVEQVSRLCDLDTATVIAILDRLTYQPGPKADLCLTPFLQSENNVVWSPTGIIKMRHERNLLKVMARGPKTLSDHAATVNGRRDRPLALLIAAEFNKRGYQYKLEERIAHRSEQTDIDVLLWLSSKPKELLIIEAKAILPPDEINEVHDAAKVMITAQNQILQAIDILKSMPIDEKRQKFKFVPWHKIEYCAGVVATTDAEPHTKIDQKVVPVISLNTLRLRFRAQDFRSPRRFIQTCVDRPWLRTEVIEGKQNHIDVSVGELTYRLPARTLDANPNRLHVEKYRRIMTRTFR